MLREKNKGISLSIEKKIKKKSSEMDHTQIRKKQNMESLEARARKGECAAKNVLFFKLFFGVGSKRNQKAGKKWCLQSARQGSLLAGGMLYFCGWQEKNDEEKAFSLFDKFCVSERGEDYSYGLNMVGYCYDIGKGVTQNYLKAYQFYLKAAELGNDLAINNLGSNFSQISRFFSPHSFFPQHFCTRKEEEWTRT